jgi:hypothetical protein
MLIQSPNVFFSICQNQCISSVLLNFSSAVSINAPFLLYSASQFMCDGNCYLLLLVFRYAPNSQLVAISESSNRSPDKAFRICHACCWFLIWLWLGRHSVGRPAPAISLDLKSSAFDPKEKVWTKFPPEGSKHTPPHQSSEFKWKDYCPVVFRSELETCSFCARAGPGII